MYCRFQALFEALQLPGEWLSDYFRNTEIEKVIVNPANQTWVIKLKADNLLPLEVYEALHASLQKLFSRIAHVDLRITYKSCDKVELLKSYWPGCLKKIGAYHRTSGRLLSQCTWEYLDDSTVSTLQINVPNTAAYQLLQAKEIVERLKSYIECVSGLCLHISLKVNEALQASRWEQFNHEKAIEETQLIHEAVSFSPEPQAETRNKNEHWKIGYTINDETVPLSQIREEEKRVAVKGRLFSKELRELKSGRTLFTCNITDNTDSIQLKYFTKDKQEVEIVGEIKEGEGAVVRGRVEYDTFAKELVLMVTDMHPASLDERTDNAPEKRVELHLHTSMSAMDGVVSASRMVARAAKWGHSAVAITDHGVVQAFPEAHEAGQKHGIKIIYGVEANVVDDGVPIVHQSESRPLKEQTYVIFDTETTGLSANYHTIIEIAAVKIKGGEVIDTFQSFINPHVPIDAQITKLTGITDDMVKDAPDLEPVLRQFESFIDGTVLAAHNSRFDMAFLNMSLKKINRPACRNPVIDTVELARFLYPGLKNYRLNTLAAKFKIKLENHHRALDDAAATGELLWQMINDLDERHIHDLEQLNQYAGSGETQRSRPFHATLLVKNSEGLKNLYQLISLSHLNYFYRIPRIPRSELLKYREGLLIGSGCANGELFEAVMQKSSSEVEEMARFYDFIEVQPIKNHYHLIRRGVVNHAEQLEDVNRRLVSLGEKLDIPVVATSNAHYLDPEDRIFRDILTAGKNGMMNDEHVEPRAFMTTDEMLEAFRGLGEDKAYRIVVENTNNIASQIEAIKPFPDELFTPVIEGAEDEIREMSTKRAKEIYGDPLPDLVEARLERELNSIIGHGFAVIYLIAHKLVTKSLSDGYLVGSRGSVGSSFVATMTDITEVNPLPPHYVCPNCKYSHFFNDGSIGSGYDLAEKDCPSCGTPLHRDGHDIPFETFMGFKGDKVPDIDLNFSGEYQPRAHKYTEELFGREYVYRAGTISTVAEKTAYGFVKKFEEENQVVYRAAEIDRLVKGCTGIKRTTGQHPGGLMVIPQYMDVHDFTPIQRPADDPSSDTITTHFDYHAISGRLLKLDILGHDDPTIIRMLQDLSGRDPKTIPVNDPKVLSLFSSTEALGVTPEQIGSITGTLGIPEFGTKFVRQMLEDTKPTTFAELVRISGLSHGTDVWLNNAQDLVRQGTAVLSEVISTRDDIMVYLIHRGLDPSTAFKIMEKVRKGKGLAPEDEEEMRKHDIPDWYIASCNKIKYMFPKAHATAYVLMALRIAYFKVYYPIYFYATYFSVRADDFDVELVCQGASAIRQKLAEVEQKGVQATAKEKNLATVLELALEMIERGFSFKTVNLYESDAENFLVDGDALIPPLTAIAGLGKNVARNIVNARREGVFLSKEDFQSRTKASKTIVETLERLNCLTDLPESNQLSLF